MTDDETAHTRRSRLEQRRRRIRWTGVLVASVILGGAAIVAAFATTDDAPATSGAESLTGVSSGGADTTSSTVARAFAVRPVSHAAPLRLWIGGDSLAGALGPALGTLTGGTGVVEPHVDYRVSSGVIPGSRDWQAHAEAAMAEKNPEVVVFMIGTNDGNVVNSQDFDDDDVPDWEVDYRERVAKLMDTFAGDDGQRTVVWIGAPTIRDDARDADIVEVNRVMREEAERRAPQVLYFDAYAHFADEDGEYADRVEIGENELVRVRNGDGVHFTPAGAQHLANSVFALIDARFRLLAEADVAQPIAVTIAEGGELSGGRSGSGSDGSGYGSDSDSDSNSDSNGSNNRGNGSGGSPNNRRSPTTVAPETDEDEAPVETEPQPEPEPQPQPEPQPEPEPEPEPQPEPPQPPGGPTP